MNFTFDTIIRKHNINGFRGGGLSLQEKNVHEIWEESSKRLLLPRVAKYAKNQPSAIPIGKAELLEHSGNDRVAIFSLGNMLPVAREIAAALAAEGVPAAVINARFTKPLDVEMIEQYGRSAEVLLTLEDHALAGGFGSAVLEELNRLGSNTPVVRIGWPDQFIEHGKPDELRQKYGLTAEAALARVRQHLGIPA
jgi:1-deoxy-D-xylulose-5-phosphate synthase